MLSANADPYVLYTDIVAGPTSGGEGDDGAYLNIFGVGFGGSLGDTTKVYCNGAEIPHYIVLQDAKAQPFSKTGGPTLKHIGVQVGTCNSLAAGSAGEIKVSVSGVDSNVGHTFTNQPGDMIYVSLTGSDVTGDGSFAAPYRYVQNSAKDNPAWLGWSKGDFLVMRGGTWEDQGADSYFLLIDSSKDGNAPNGTTDNGYMTITGYPGETVTILVHDWNSGATMNGGIKGPGTAFNTTGNYVAVSNLIINDDDDDKANSMGDGPINSSKSGDHWRVVNNEVTADIGSIVEQRAGGFSGSLLTGVLYGNKIHKIAGAGELNHGFYFGNGLEYSDIAFNYLNTTDGSCVQVYSTTTVTDSLFHHNLLDGAGKHGFNHSSYEAYNLHYYNNIVMHIEQACFRNGTITQNDVFVSENTFFDCLTGGVDAYGSIFNTAQVPNTSDINFENNIIWTKSGERYYVNYTILDDGVFFDNNGYYNGINIPDQELAEVTGDPGFLSTTTGSENLSVLSTGAGVNTGKTPSISITDDINLNVRPSGLYDIGAFEYIAPTIFKRPSLGGKLPSVGGKTPALAQ